MIWRFADFVLDTEVPELRRGGIAVRIEPQVFDLLTCLVSNSDRIVSKDELVETVWKGRIVSDATITSRINLARQALGDSGREQALLRTFPKRGWRFVAEVSPAVADVPSDSGKADYSGDTAGAGSTSILVLPFRQLTEGGAPHLAEGITADLIVALSRFRELDVISINTALKLSEPSGRLENRLTEIAATYLVSGTVRLDGDRLLLTAQLSEKSSGTTIWSERFDRKIDDLFQLQGELVEEIAGRLPWRLIESEGRSLHGSTAPKLSSYRAFLKATWEAARHDDIRNEIADIQKIIDLDPDYAPARAQAAFLLGYKVFRTGQQTPDDVAHSLAHARAALRLDREDERVLSKAAISFQFAGDFPLAARCSEMAMAINPNSTECTHFRATILGASGDARAALDLHRKTMRLDPLFPEEHYEGMMEAYYLLGRYDDALGLFRKWTLPETHVHLFAAACHANLGQLSKARDLTERFSASCPEGFSNAAFVRAMLRYHQRPEDRAHWLDGFRAAGLQGIEEVTA